MEKILPSKLMQHMHVKFTPAEIEEIGGFAFESAFELMVDVITSHLMWTLDHIESGNHSK